MAKMTIFARIANMAKHKAMRGPIKVGDTGEFGKYGKYGKNDNFARIANMAKHKAMRGPIKVGDTGEFGKYGENDNFATFANKAKHKAMRGPIKAGDTGENCHFRHICHNCQPGMEIYKRFTLQRVLGDSKNYVELNNVSLQGIIFSKPHRKYFLVV